MPTIARHHSTPARRPMSRTPRAARPSRPTRTPRFSRTNAAPSTGFRPTHFRRQQPKQSGIQSALSKVVPGALAGKTARKSSSKSSTSHTKRNGGMALLAGAAGLAFKNRDKLTGMMGRSKTQVEPETHARTNSHPATGPTGPAQTPGTPAL